VGLKRASAHEGDDEHSVSPNWSVLVIPSTIELTEICRQRKRHREIWAY
jgi:hypothetical protein